MLEIQLNTKIGSVAGESIGMRFRLHVQNFIDGQRQGAQLRFFYCRPDSTTLGFDIEWSIAVKSVQNYRNIRRQSANFSCRVQAIHAGHGEVHDNEIGMQFDRLVNRFSSVQRLATNLPVPITLEHRAHSL